MIDKFRGKYRFLSNFYPANVVLAGADYPSVEHAYQASKTSNPWIRKNIMSIKEPRDVKIYSRSYESRPDWEEFKPKIMFDLLTQKFSKDPLRQMLSETGDEILIEGNTWHDRYWGKCYCDNCGGNGENLLGILLMRVRDEIRRENGNKKVS